MDTILLVWSFGALVCGITSRRTTAAFRPTDQLDHFVQAPADHVDHLFVGLGHADDLVRRSNLLGLVCRACRHQAHDLHLVIVALQDGTDAFQRTGSY